jgi:hypothetical protein
MRASYPTHLISSWIPNLKTSHQYNCVPCQPSDSLSPSCRPKKPPQFTASGWTPRAGGKIAFWSPSVPFWSTRVRNTWCDFDSCGPANQTAITAVGLCQERFDAPASEGDAGRSNKGVWVILRALCTGWVNQPEECASGHSTASLGLVFGLNLLRYTPIHFTSVFLNLCETAARYILFS